MMATLNLTATDNRQQTVLDHLIPIVSDTLAEKINNGVYIEKDGKRLLNKKDLSTFMSYAEEQAKKTLTKQQRTGTQTVCVHGDDIMSWAIHYFEEDSIEGKLYNEDGTEYVPPKPVKKTTAPTVPYTPPKPKPEPQLSLFDILGTQKKEEPAPASIPDQPDEEDDEDDEPIEEEIAEVMEQEQEEQQTAPPLPPVTKQPSALYQHYLNIQNKYPDAVVALRVGDFYEIFGANAVKVAKKLDMTLTGRDFGLEERIPMIGIPYHASDYYIGKLVGLGYKVAIAEDITSNYVTVKESDLCVDEETGEVLPVEEMRKFDGDIEEPRTPTVQTLPPDDEDDDLPPLDTDAYDSEALSILDELFGDMIILR